ncbi:putative helitron helicase-like domain-containing protein, partial [Tanacetum coccineum]
MKGHVTELGTTVTRVGSFDNNPRGFKFEHFSSFTSITFTERELCDVIGTVVSVLDAIPFNNFGKDQLRRTIILEDVFYVKLRKPSVSPAMYSTKLYLNDDIQEIAAFRQRYSEKEGFDPANHIIALLTPVKKEVTADDFFKGAIKKTVVVEDTASSSSNKDIDRQLTKNIKDMLDKENPLVRQFRMAGQQISDGDSNVKIRLIGRRDSDGRQHNLPTADEVVALILHVEYLPLQYPLLFPYAEDGYRTDIYLKGITDDTPDKKKKYVTMRQWFAYRIQERPKVFSTILNGKRLFQQFLVDGYTMVEAERLLFVRNHQKELRCETYSRLQKAAESSNPENPKRGTKVVLPSSFTGGPRYMLQNYLDAMAMCKWYGYPDLFITFTCNPKWPEITRFLNKRGLKSEDSPDVTTRIFKIKLDQLIKDIKEKRIFGRVRAATQQFSGQTTEHQFSDNVGDDHLNYEYFQEKGELETFKREDDSFVCAIMPNNGSTQIRTTL